MLAPITADIYTLFALWQDALQVWCCPKNLEQHVQTYMEIQKPKTEFVQF